VKKDLIVSKEEANLEALKGLATIIEYALLFNNGNDRKEEGRCHGKFCL